MRHLYRITGRHGVDVVAAETPVAALAAWEAQRGPSGDPEGDTAECRQIPEETVLALAPGLLEALQHALEWLGEQGCDCGTDEPGTCALCEAVGALDTLAAHP